MTPPSQKKDDPRGRGSGRGGPERGGGGDSWTRWAWKKMRVLGWLGSCSRRRGSSLWAPRNWPSASCFGYWVWSATAFGDLNLSSFHGQVGVFSVSRTLLWYTDCDFLLCDCNHHVCFHCILKSNEIMPLAHFLFLSSRWRTVWRNNSTISVIHANLNY